MSAEDPATSPPQPIRRRHVVAAVVGNWLEFYDFTIYAYFALQIGDAFFPNYSPFAKLMLSLITFGAGFVCRPIGAIVLGAYADRVGRRPAMLISFGLMGLAILGLVFVPDYKTIGVAAPILAVTFRIIQGFALGGEVGPTTAYLVEAAPPGRRGLFGAWQSGSQSLASISGGLIGAAMAFALSESDFKTIGWRIAFLIGALVLPFGFIIRRSLPETRHHDEPALAAHPEIAAGASYAQTILGHWRIIVLGLCLILGGTISTYVFTYMTTYAQTTLHQGVKISFWVTVVNGTAGFIASIGGGVLSDRFGRKPLMIWPRLVFLLAIVPVFLLINHVHSVVVLLTTMGALNLVANLTGVPALVAITESLRKDIRGASLATIYATSVAVFGGTTQPIVAWLEHVTHNPMAIAWYLTAATLIALVASVLMTETAGPKAAIPSRAA